METVRDGAERNSRSVAERHVLALREKKEAHCSAGATGTVREGTRRRKKESHG